MNTPTTPLPRGLLDALMQAGYDLQALARSVGLEALQLETGVSRGEMDRFLCAAWDAVADPSFGLKVGSVLRTERLGVSGLAAMTSPDFGTALRRKARYNRLVWGDDYQIAEDAKRFKVTIVGLDESRPYGPAKIDMEMASLRAFGRHFTGTPMQPLAVTLRRAAPAWRCLYAQLLGVEPVFEQPANSISFRRQDTDLRLISTDARAHAGLVEAAEAALAPLEGFGIAAKVRLEIEALLSGGEPTLADIARRLHLSERTLQRRLADEGQRYSALLDGLRRTLAERKLRAGAPTAPELAFLLGFADTNSFYRAFKRWTGTTPELFRRQAASLDT